ncbi:iron chelate uptake ABC transporter family permease subunit [Shouchella clausii]|jgi:iron complex transport system permease protein|uniref:Iron chelate uptake ABC transporter family permease subunit n=1 Tax=Shouchella rhizosphaerae TaxID=866786 RepID=A0ABZ2CUE1_9BACI|nr:MULTISPECIES: iron chelate uptake ABC transporter family permease subunit [Shouchella]MCM3313704.1 iron chelate uptake ABC transporter family permease subunit [Psychrobacillus sp. MER TA 17]ALA54240.1 Putative iron compound ABC uptake transporter, permease protein [Shouchella clausii]MBU3233327.1 iron chelate uptake ABC transporter family permease subunit [Shouchella clausii]MBU3266316.1 iron chelate uptake ABC transporter family permease subunit [Shouchella clausii]MBU3509406.1 iron chelat
MQPKWIYLLLGAMLAALVGTFLFIDIAPGAWDYALPRRGRSVVAIVIVGGAIASSTLFFQTITNNRILTPSIIGLDSLYMLIQTLLVFLFGTIGLVLINQYVNFGLSIVFMVLFAVLLYALMFKKEGQNLYFLLLVGIVFGTLFSSLSTFLQVMIDPNEFLTIQNRMFASFSNINVDLLWISIVILAATVLYIWPYLKYLDAISLGRDQAINLGVPYDRAIKKFLVVIALLVSVSTALVGPVLFLGLLVANVARELMPTYKHTHLVITSVLVSSIALVGGTLLVERVFTYSAPLSVIINFVGGIYFIYLLLRGTKST